MADLIDVLHGIMQENMKSGKPTDLCFGTVSKASPVEIQLETTMQPIPAAAIVLTEAVVARSVTATTSDGATVTIEISRALEAGDRVVMIRAASGQRFIVLSRVTG